MGELAELAEQVEAEAGADVDDEATPDESGDLERKDTRDLSMQSTHYGAQGKQLKSPEGA